MMSSDMLCNDTDRILSQFPKETCILFSNCFDN